MKNSYFVRNIKNHLYKTPEEVVEQLNRKDIISKKKCLMKKYEEKLNKQLGLDGHYIIK